MIKLALTPLFMLTFPPVIPTTLIPLSCSTSPMTSLFTIWPPWPPSLHPSGPLIQATLTKLLCQLTLPLHVFSHGYSHMGYTFEGLTGRTSTKEIGERMHEARFRRVQALPQEDDIFAWIIQPRRRTLNHVPAWRKALRRLTRVFPCCST